MVGRGAPRITFHAIQSPAGAAGVRVGCFEVVARCDEYGDVSPGKVFVAT